MFIDLVKINIKSGSGGNGMVAWRREKYIPKGGPSGGDGGKGGNVILQADQSISTLLEFKYKSIYAAEVGENGKTKNCHGKNGKDLIIKVPVGTIVKDVDTDTIIADLYQDEQQALIAGGGRGGRGNASFTSATRQAPQFCEPGEAGIQRDIQLELKLLADVGLIGMPNAGKSTLISVISAAKPKIADYPFTTLVPNLGVVKTPDGKGIVFADIPGLIKGASEGQGLGHQFLRHVERTRLLLHLVDILEEDPVENYNAIRQELENYDTHLIELEEIIIINKIDTIDKETVHDIKEQLEQKDKKVFCISAVTREGIKDLLDYVLEKITTIPQKTIIVEVEEDLGANDHDDSHFTISKHKKSFIVEGGKVKRLINVTDLQNTQAVFRLQNILKSMGVFDALKDAGATDGDNIVIDKFEFDYYED